MKAIAFHLPQFHPIPENDAWWGNGFTEWTNVAKARPRFSGHGQPHLPADLGFYDLRLSEVRERQAELALEYGVGGFCYYHYWFNGKRLLERPVNEILRQRKPDFPFCLCWANENWTRVWDGGDRQVLMAQNHCSEDDLDHIRYLFTVFTDERYIQIDGRPLFLVYRPSLFPKPKRTVETWREEANRLGVADPFLCIVESMQSEHNHCQEWGFDAAVEFAPDWTQLGPAIGRSRTRNLLRKMKLFNSPYYASQVYEYKTIADNMLRKPDPSYLRFPGITPMWDNSARRSQNAIMLRGSTPNLYESWLKAIVNKIKDRPLSRQLIFINAWNEWAEGNHLEPCQRWGRQYLEATQRALSTSST